MNSHTHPLHIPQLISHLTWSPLVSTYTSKLQQSHPVPGLVVGAAVMVEEVAEEVAVDKEENTIISRLKWNNHKYQRNIKLTIHMSVIICRPITTINNCKLTNHTRAIGYLTLWLKKHDFEFDCLFRFCSFTDLIGGNKPIESIFFPVQE